MKDETIRSVLEKINAGFCEEIIAGPIAENVLWGFVWQPLHDDRLPYARLADEIFFVKANDGKFAAAVHRLGADDMHWFVLEEYRGKSVLVAPLQEVILPFIFKTNQDVKTQAGTLDLKGNFAAYSARLAEKTGFKKISETDDQFVYEIDRTSVKPYKPFERSGISPIEFKRIEKQIFLNTRSLQMALHEIRVKYACAGAHPITDMAEEMLLNLNSSRIELVDALRYETVIAGQKKA